MTHVRAEVEQLVVLPGVVQVRLAVHRNVCQALLHSEDVPTPTERKKMLGHYFCSLFMNG